MPVLADAYLTLMALVWLGLMALGLSKRGPGKPKARKGYAPRTLVMVPCKGDDIAMDAGLRSIRRQDYRNYDVIAIADSVHDSSIRHIENAGIRWIARKDRGSGSRKVMALCTAMERFPDYEVYVVADSDIRCRRNWLSSLVGPLADTSVGSSTAFPYFLPVSGSGFWTRVKMVWGFVGNGLMESERTRFVWGGSMAFRKGLLKGAEMRRFRNSISDDIAITRITKEKGLRIAYSDGVVEVPSDDDFARFSEWSTRQTAFSVRGGNSNFRNGVIFYGANALLLYSAIALSALYSPACAVLLAPFGLRLWKTYRRSRDRKPDIFLICLFIDLVYLVNLAKAKRMRGETWRGVSYGLERV